MEDKLTHPSMSLINDSILSRESWKIFQIMGGFIRLVCNHHGGVGEGSINKEDLNLVQIIDDPKQITNAIFKHYEQRGLAPSAEVLLHL